ncbi:hypothetical protein RvY_12458-2 [Ramazzottius varieornatus]|uniref:Kinesin motor domain-containing protein n=1 Tax=Ramazzottius varieornatus TaxID=947166 RepID=A0A1D1VJL1_RAMVA|nr:hypothetical protein RvY_12458-2 [Ramazzottius varieornatus]
MTSAEMHPSHCSLTGSLSSSASFRRSERARRRVAECAPGSPSSAPSYRCHNMPPVRLPSAAITHEPYFTNFAQLLRKNMPPAPPQLLKNPGRKDNGPGKVKVLLRVAGPQEESGTSWMSIDQRRKQVNLLDPSMVAHYSSSTVAQRSRSALPPAPKMFTFDSIFAPDTSQSEMAATALVDLLHSVVNGVDGCLISHGQAKLGKTYSVVGCDSSATHAGLIPSAMSWLFRLMEEEKEKSGVRYTIRISAVEVSGSQETVTDLLADQALDHKAGNGSLPFCDDPRFSCPLLNPNELLANSAEEAARLLDHCLSIRRQSGTSSSSHMFFTLRLYQYRLDKSGAGGVSGDRSRLTLIDLGSQAGDSLSLSGLGNVLLALINGQKHVPCKDSKISQLLRDSLSSVSSHTVLLCHVSCATDKYHESLSVVQMASRVHRMRRKRIRTGVGSASGDSCRLTSRTGSSEVSSSEASAATTVIFCGGKPQANAESDANSPSLPSALGGAPQSLLCLSHSSPVRRPTIPPSPLAGESIQPILRPKMTSLKSIAEDTAPPRVASKPPLRRRRVESPVDPHRLDMVQQWVDREVSQDAPLVESVVTCDAGQQVSQLDILHETHDVCMDTPEPPTAEHFSSNGMQDSDFEINQGDLDALEALASQLSSQMDLFSFDMEKTDSVQPSRQDQKEEQEKTYPPPPAPLLPNLKWDSLWLPPTATHKTGTPSRQQSSLPKKAVPLHVILPPVPVRSSSVPRPRLKKATVLTTSPVPSEDSGHDSAFSLARPTLPVSTRLAGSKCGSTVGVNSKRSPSQSSSGLGSDGNSSVGSAVQVSPPTKSATTLVNGLKMEGSKSLPATPRHRPAQPEGANKMLQPLIVKQNLWSKLPCFGGNGESDMA